MKIYNRGERKIHYKDGEGEKALLPKKGAVVPDDVGTFLKGLYPSELQTEADLFEDAFGNDESEPEVEAPKKRGRKPKEETETASESDGF